MAKNKTKQNKKTKNKNKNKNNPEKEFFWEVISLKKKMRPTKKYGKKRIYWIKEGLALYTLKC